MRRRGARAVTVGALGLAAILAGGCGGRKPLPPLSAIVDEHMADLFPGMRVTGCFPFRITRDSELWVDTEEVDNLLQALKGELPRLGVPPGRRG